KGTVMKRFRPLSLLLVFVCFASAAYSQANAPLKMSQTIPLPGVEGRIDHMSVDVKGQRLFVAALGNNTVEVVDLAQGKRSRSITGLKEPQGIVYITTLDQVVVANGADGTVRTFDARSFTTISSLDLGDDADNVRYDSTVGRLVVGYGDGALGMIDLKTHKVISSIKLSGHPESFQLEKSRPRLQTHLSSIGCGPLSADLQGSYCGRRSDIVVCAGTPEGIRGRPSPRQTRIRYSRLRRTVKVNRSNRIDVVLLCLTGFLRSFATGLMGVVFGIYLFRLGRNSAEIGILTAAGLAGATIATAWITWRGDRLGRRTALILFALLSMAGGVGLAFVS